LDNDAPLKEKTEKLQGEIKTRLLEAGKTTEAQDFLFYHHIPEMQRLEMVASENEGSPDASVGVSIGDQNPRQTI
jgi:hypothetical protein